LFETVGRAGVAAAHLALFRGHASQRRHGRT
jgi:hypothetical protein